MDTLKADLAEMKARMTTWMERWEPMIPMIRSLPHAIGSLTESLRGVEQGLAEERSARRQELSEERSARRELSKDVREDLSRHRDEVADLHKRYGNAG
jgi:chromosome segregation ATPase